jgi:hypothetical protein
MPTAEMDREFGWRLKAALDRITPPPSAPRYASLRPGVRAWRIAPVLLGGATAILLALAATASTGSSNPAVWTGDAVSAIGSVGHPSVERTPPGLPQPAPAPRNAPVPVPTHESDHPASPEPEPSERPEASPTAQPSRSPAPSDDHSGSGDHSGSSAPTSSPSPSPGSDH